MRFGALTALARGGRLVLAVGMVLGSRAWAEDQPPAPERWEPGGTPILSADSDVGVGLGAIGSLARFRPTCAWPYCWRLEAQIYFTIKGSNLPYHDHHIKLDLPGALGGRLRFYLQIGFARYNTSGYYGMGNASPSLDAFQSRYHQYDRIYPQVEANARLSVAPRLSMIFGAVATYNRMTVYRRASPLDPYASKLEHDLERGDAVTRDLLRGTSSHALGQLLAGLVYDSRDHELIPARGMFHEISGRFSPAAVGDDISYFGANLTLRLFRGLWRDRLVVALRAMADLLFGDPPFYELARCGGLFDTGAIGGGGAVRGVPLQRYYGKAKLLANFELRGRIIPFRVKSQRFNLGLVAFFDAGRTWADYASRPELDGSGAGLKFGTGGGLRIQWGETFLLRGDVAYSPDASPVGFYVDVGHIF